MDTTSGIEGYYLFDKAKELNINYYEYYTNT